MTHLEESQRQVVQLLLLTEPDEELLAELGVEEDLLFFKLQFWFPSLSPYRGTEGGDVVTNIVNTGFLNIVSSQSGTFCCYNYIQVILPAGVWGHQEGDFSYHT